MKKLQVPKPLLNLDYALTGVMFVVLVGVTFLGVIFRYALGQPFSWLEEVQLMLFVGITYLGAGAAFRTGSHVAIEFVIDLLPSGARRIAEWIISAIVVATLIYFMFRGFDVLGIMQRVHRTTNILNVPYTAIYAVLPIGCILMIINYVLATYFGVREDDPEVEEVPQI